MKLPAVTIGLPFCNNKKTLRKCIASILAQSFSDFELLIIADGSSDGSSMIPASFKDPRIRFIQESHCLGLATRLNQIANLARGEILFRMDADDVMHPERVSRQVTSLHQLGQETVVGSAAINVNSAFEPIEIDRRRSLSRPGFAARHAFIHPTVAAWTKWFRGNQYSELPVFRRCQDAELWVRTSYYTQFFNDPEPLLFYRKDEGINIEKQIWQTLALITILSGRCKETKTYRCSQGLLELAKLAVRYTQHLALPALGKRRPSSKLLRQYQSILFQLKDL